MDVRAWICLTIVAAAAILNLPATGAFITLGLLSAIPFSYVSQRIEDRWLWMEEGSVRRGVLRAAHGAISVMGTLVVTISLMVAVNHYGPVLLGR